MAPNSKNRSDTRWQLILPLMLLAIHAVSSRPNTPFGSSWDNIIEAGGGISRRNTATSEMLKQHLRQALSKCTSKDPPPMQKVLLRDRRAVCNDGSSAGYFIRKSYGSQRWIVFLEGGWYCFDKRSCESRWNRLRGFMTSAMWPETRQVGGILSPDPEENPYWWNANHVYVPYCSSDSWSGSSPAGTNSRFAFMGSSIVREVLRDLLSQGLLNASKLILTGSSAGGIGVLLNLDRAAEFLHSHGSLAEVRGVSDSGWFLDNVPYAPADCYDPARCAPTTAVQLGYNLWNGQVPEACRNQYPAQPWRCFFGHHLYRTLRTPLFVFQWLFDEAQMTADNVGPPMSKEQWDYIHAVGDDLRRTLANVTAVFAPSCISHTVLTKRDWQTIRIGDINLAQALRCWELQPSYVVANHVSDEAENSVALTPAELLEQNTHALRHSRRRYKSARVDSSPVVLLADDPELPQGSLVKPARNLVRSGQHPASINGTSLKPARNSTRRKGEKRKDRRNKQRQEQGSSGEKKRGRKQQKEKGVRITNQRSRNSKNVNTNRSSSSSSSSSRNKGKGRKHKKDKTKTTTTTESRIRPKRAESWKSSSLPEFCQHRLTDRCAWPQCNRMCPKLHNPFTGEEMDFIQLLKSFGLDMSSVANALGIDLHTLNNMDHDVLLHLLTQQTT